MAFSAASGTLSRWLLPAAVAVLTGLAWAHRFIQDDAFISFRYAENLAAGHGLVWNPGQVPVEGYTNFLWTVLMTVPHAVGWDPVLFSQLLGSACFAWALLATARLAAHVAPDSGSVLPAVVLVGTNYSFLCWATGGMATMLQAAMLTTCALLASTVREDDRRTIRHPALFSFLGAMAVLVRPDSLLPVGILGLFTLAGVLRGPALLSRRLVRIAALALPLGLILTLYALWKMSYFGSLIPNTWQAKAAELTSARAGLRYVLEFGLSYGWLPVVVAAVALARRVRLSGAGMLAMVVVAWLMYVVRIGGDFMEFRFLVPVLPVAVVLLVAVMGTEPMVRARPFLVAGLVVASVAHGQLFSFRAGIESVNDLRSHLVESDWDEVGRTLGRELGDLDPPVIIATTAAGVVPYYSGLRTVDMVGLNDPDIARHGAVLSRHAGHKRTATARQLLERDVHLVVGHPQVQDLDEPVPVLTVANAGFGMADLATTSLPAGARVVGIPLEAGRQVLVLVFKPHAELARRIETAGWPSWPVERPGPDR